MSDVQGHCPACGGSSLFLGEGGHVTCRRLDCPDPSAADDMLGEGAPMLHRVAVLASDLFMAGKPGPERETARKFLEALQRPEPRLLACEFCYEEQGEEVHPHPECPVGRSQGPIVGTARIALDVKPGFADGLTSGEDADRKVLLPVVEMTGAASLPLGDRVDRGFVLVGDLQSKMLIGGRRLAVSADKPVVVEPFGPGIPGGAVTLTLNCERVTIDGREVGDV